MGINGSSRIGVRVTSSNSNGGPVLDTMGDGSFQYIKLDQTVVQPAQTAIAMPSGTAVQVPYGITSANTTVSPGNKGLLVLVGDNPVQNESAVLQLVR